MSGVEPTSATSQPASQPPDADTADAECVWVCRYCRMGVSCDGTGFAPSVHYAGRCSRNPDRDSGEHDWRRADLEPEEE